MFSALVFLFRLVAGLVILTGAWFVFDRIHDRNTEIIMATIGLLYSFIFIISGRLQSFGLPVFSFLRRWWRYSVSFGASPRFWVGAGIGCPNRSARSSSQPISRCLLNLLLDSFCPPSTRALYHEAG